VYEQTDVVVVIMMAAANAGVIIDIILDEIMRC
jgi:hypothetical protein